MAELLTTLTPIWAELGIAGGGPSDVYLYSLIAAVSDAIDSWCGRTFGIAQRTETFRLRPCAPIVLSSRPVVSLDAVTIDGVAATGFDLDNAAGMISARCWPGTYASITYTAGYVLPTDPTPPDISTPDRTLPYDIERACILWVKRAYLAQPRDPSLRSKGLSSLEEISYFQADPDNLAPDVASLLARHREPCI